MGRRLQLAACWLALAALVASSAGGVSLRARGQEARVSAGHAWTLDEALAHLALHPRDAYVQYVALRLAGRAGRYEEVAGRLRSTTPALNRVTADDLFSVFTGALAVQESLQLDTMRPADGGIGQNADAALELLTHPSAQPPPPVRPTAPPRRGTQTRRARTRRTTQPRAANTEGPRVVASTIPPGERSPVINPAATGGDVVPVSSLQGPTVKSHSTMVLAVRLQTLKDQLPGMFTIGQHKVIPNVAGVFKRGQDVGIFMQVYNAGVDQTTLRPSVDVEYVLMRNGKEVMKQAEDWRGISDSGQRLTLARLLPTAELPAGDYEIAIRVRDRVSGQSLSPTRNFTVVEDDKK